MIERVEDAEIILKASGVPVRIGGDKAFYNPAGDFIQLPPDEAFESPALRASVALHELSHASGHRSRTESRSVRKIRLISILARRVAGRTFEPARRLRDRFADRYSRIMQATFAAGSTFSNRTSARSSTLRPMRNGSRITLGFHPDYAERPIESADDGDDGTSSVVAPLAA